VEGQEKVVPNGRSKNAGKSHPNGKEKTTIPEGQEEGKKITWSKSRIGGISNKSEGWWGVTGKTKSTHLIVNHLTSDVKWKY